MMYNKCSVGTLTKKPQKDGHSTINMSAIMTQHYPQKFAILHMVGGVVNSTKKTCYYNNMSVNVNPVTGI